MHLQVRRWSSSFQSDGRCTNDNSANQAHTDATSLASSPSSSSSLSSLNTTAPLVHRPCANCGACDHCACRCHAKFQVCDNLVEDCKLSFLVHLSHSSYSLSPSFSLSLSLSLNLSLSFLFAYLSAHFVLCKMRWCILLDDFVRLTLRLFPLHPFFRAIVFALNTTKLQTRTVLFLSFGVASNPSRIRAAL